jgi:hypothetical protein
MRLFGLLLASWEAEHTRTPTYPDSWVGLILHGIDASMDEEPVVFERVGLWKLSSNDVDENLVKARVVVREFFDGAREQVVRIF